MTEDINILTFDNFIQKIKSIKTYRSNANKEYKVVKVNKTALVLRDQRTKADFEVPAAQVFAAMKELGIENCTVLKMRQYVGTHAAPASAALIFWAFGRGQVQAAMKKFADLAFRIIREQQNENRKSGKSLWLKGFQLIIDGEKEKRLITGVSYRVADILSHPFPLSLMYE